jgi:hypothetical protein
MPTATCPSAEFVLAIHRFYLTQVRLERSISSAIADLERYRKERNERRAEIEPKPNERYQTTGLLWASSEGSSYTALPKVLGLDGVWREIPREVLGDFPKSQGSADALLSTHFIRISGFSHQ